MGKPGLVHNAYIADGALGIRYIAADKRELRDGFRWVVRRVGGRREYVKQRLTAWGGPQDGGPRRQWLCRDASPRVNQNSCRDDTDT